MNLIFLQVMAVVMAILVLLFSQHLWRRYTEFRDLARPSDDSPINPPTQVTIVIPARNEEANIERCVASLLKQTHSDFDLVVVDDRSTDRTPNIVRDLEADPRVRLESAPPLPPGWIGKCHAMWVGSRGSQADWLFFIDADTASEPELLLATINRMKEQELDLISVIPDQELETVAEGIIQPIVFAVLQIFVPPARANNPQDKLGHISGQCFCVRREAYEEFGGHKNSYVRGAISEDTAFGQGMKDTGYRIEIVSGHDLVNTRMYTTVREIWNGWVKNFYPGLENRKILLPIALIAGVWTIIYYTFVLITGNIGPTWMWWLNILSFVYLVLSLGYVRWKIGQIVVQPAWYTLTYPIGILFVGGVALASMIQNMFRIGSLWKGRRYL